MNHAPLVSVLIPVYNSEFYLEETILSILDQSYTNIELVIVDDGSTDKSLKIARKYEGENVIVISSENKGASQARNTAFKHSTGDLIQYLDADDLLSTYKIENQVTKYLKSEDKEIILSGNWGRFNDSIKNLQLEVQEINKSYDAPHLWLVDSWSNKGMSSCASWLTPRSVICKAGEWDPTISMNDDGEFFCRVLLNSSKIIFVNGSIAYYRSDNKNSLSNTISSKSLDSELRSIILYKNHFERFGFFDTYRHVLIGKLYNFLVSFPSLSKEQVNQAVRLLNEWNISREKPVLKNKLLKTLATFLGFKRAILLRNKIKA